MKNKKLLSSKIIETIKNLHFRIEERFPGSGLAELCGKLHKVSQKTDKTINWIEKPNYLLRIFFVVVIASIIMTLSLTIQELGFKFTTFTLPEFIQVFEAGLNAVFLVGAVFVFLFTVETRRKRKRIVIAINHLRSIAHIIDAHQLTKDPDEYSKVSVRTAHSPTHHLSKYELCRYLDYCSEMLSLTSKVAFLYTQNFDDPVSQNAINELESLTTGLSRKIWQKIMVAKLYDDIR
ncbi:MAG: hypothetical protein KJ950_15295 [Proteobacteria bacterium]|nr:hypothetical protein [Pseudomonadota bacterium]MBU1686890.1 hypothetical protein [Pseudomonadota bacterium]